MTDHDRRSVATNGAEPTSIGELPPVGTVPATMHAQVVRQDRYGDPATALRLEMVATRGSRRTRSSSR